MCEAATFVECIMATTKKLIQELSPEAAGPETDFDSKVLTG